MFRKFGDFIHEMPWWGLLLGGLVILVALTLFATPIHVLRLSESGKTPEERSAIKREINLAFGDRALDIAESVVGTMKARATDPDRKRELDRALAEMTRARQELSRARSGISGRGIESAHTAAEAALETATAAAESTLESASDAREAIEEARDEAIAKLREKGVDPAGAARSFDELIRSARESEASARESLAALKNLRKEVPPPTPPPAPASPGSVTAPATPLPPSTGEPEGTAATRQSTVTIIDDGPATADKSSAKKGKRPGIEIRLGDIAAAESLSPEVRSEIRNKVAGDVWRVGVGSVLIVLFIPLFIMLVISKYYIGRSRRALAFAEEKKHEAKISDVNRQITEARLQALQAQVEPHFLYNTLANVQALTEADPPAANAMVGHLIQYLRAALPKMRENTSTIGQEIELVTAYLNVLKMRMGERLEFGIDVSPELMTRPFPPMMLPSLVENAIKHGLEPLREGGRIDVVARRIGDGSDERIQLEVRDTGKGLADGPAQSGSGVGLGNLRERLAALYGEAARFTIESNAPRGVIARIEIPAQVPAQALPGVQPAPQVSPAANADEAPRTGWDRARLATSKTHGALAWLASKLFLGLMTILAIAFLVALVGLFAGWLPVSIGDLELDGLEGMAFGSILLLVGFAVCALVIAIVVAVVYGVGVLVVAVLLLVPLIVLAAIFPILAPFILIGLAIYWFWWRKRKRAQRAADASSEAR